MVTKQALVDWLEDLPVDANLAVDENGALVALQDARCLDVGEPPLTWCSVCGGHEAQHLADCPVRLRDEGEPRRVLQWRPSR